MKVTHQIRRQGDILLIQAGTPRFDGTPTPTSTPNGMTVAARDRNGRIILAEGEVTGHAHAILDRDVELFVPDDLNDLADRWLRIEAEFATVVHEEHGAFEIPSKHGDVIVRRKREYQPEAPAPVYD